MAGLKSQDAVRRSKRVVWETIDNEGVLLNLNNGNYFSLNEVGLTIWEEVAENKAIDKVASTIAKKYAVSSKQALSDVLSFMDQLLKQGLVELKG